VFWIQIGVLEPGIGPIIGKSYTYQDEQRRKPLNNEAGTTKGKPTVDAYVHRRTPVDP